MRPTIQSFSRKTRAAAHHVSRLRDWNCDTVVTPGVTLEHGEIRDDMCFGPLSSVCLFTNNSSTCAGTHYANCIHDAGGNYIQSNANLPALSCE